MTEFEKEALQLLTEIRDSLNRMETFQSTHAENAQKRADEVAAQAKSMMDKVLRGER